MIPDDVIRDIRERVDIVAVIGEFVELKRAGASYKGLCPFHGDKDPSFQVRPDWRRYRCWGCGKTGDVFRFLMEHQGKTFSEAVREMAARVGVTIQERQESPEERGRREERARLLDVNAGAAAFYREVLHADAGAPGRAYLERRGIGAEVSETFKLGMAPDAWDALARRLEARRVPAPAAIAVGLIAPRREGQGHYDKFRNRLMCPVLLPAGEIVAFSGRTLGSDPDAPKYLNSPASPVFVKGNVLFGLHAARPAFRTRGRAVIVEGNFDVLALHQAGFAETVAPMGTALTPRHVEALRLIAPRVILCLDGDDAGRRAALKHLPALLEAGVETRVAALPDGDDPDTFVRRQGAPALEELLGRAQPAIEYFIHEVWGARSSRGASDRRAAVLEEAARVLAYVGNDTQRVILEGEVAHALDVDAGLVRRAVAGARAQARGPAPQSHAGPSGPRPAAPPTRAPASDRTPPPSAEVRVMSILIDNPDLFSQAEQEDVRSLLTDERLRDIYSAARAGDLVPSDLGDRVERALFSGDYATLPDPARTLGEAVRMLRSERLRAEAEEIQRSMKEADRRGDRALVRELAIRQIEIRNRAEAMRQRPEDKPR